MRQLHLNCLLGGVGLGSWRHAEAQPERLRDFSYLTELAQTAERGCMDALFCADLNSVNGLSGGQPFGYEPFTAYSALATVTRRIGLIVTASTTYNEPNNVARRLASLDHISQGRAGWNIVTTLVAQVARQYGGRPHPAPADRYRRAEEFVDVATKLWNSWPDEAITVTGEGVAKVDGRNTKPIDHKGEFFSVRGPLDVPRPPQGWPVLAQAGASPVGKAFAARHAEILFTAQPTFERARGFRSEMRERAAAGGRDPNGLRVMPGLAAVIAPTERQARDLRESLRDTSDTAARLRQLSDLLGIDLAALPPDAPIPPDLLPDISGEAIHSRVALYVELIAEKALSPRQLLAEPAHLSFTGTPDGLADLIETWFTGEAADGFNLMWPWLPGGLTLFVDEVIPRLQRRGLFRSAYQGSTLREHYALQRPERHS